MDLPLKKHIGAKNGDGLLVHSRTVHRHRWPRYRTDDQLTLAPAPPDNSKTRYVMSGLVYNAVNTEDTSINQCNERDSFSVV